jgi:hypothetical protein
VRADLIVLALAAGFALGRAPELSAWQLVIAAAIVGLFLWRFLRAR